jgi:squalene-hopene/tetraprenyl-beta-curcumene cyclase
MDEVLLERTSEAIKRGAEALFAAQESDGVFRTEVDRSSSVSTACAVITLHVADQAGSASLVAAGLRWLRGTQHADGGWSSVAGGESEVLPTVMATVAIKIATDAQDDEQVSAGLEWLRRYGGVAAIPDQSVAGLCRFFQSLVDWAEPGDLRRIPLWLFLFRGLSRRTFAFLLPVAAALSLGAHNPAARRSAPGRLLDLFARPAALSAIRQVYEHEGRTGEFGDDAWPAGMICIGLVQAGLAPDLVSATVDYIRRTAKADGSWDMMPLDITWSAFAATGLIDSGYDADRRLARTVRMLRERQQTKPFVAFDSPPGYWSWASDHGWPMVLETAETTSALAGVVDGTRSEAVSRSAAWLIRQQDSAGSWGLCVRNTRAPHMGADSYMTAQAIVALVDSGMPASDRRIRKAVKWLARSQRADGAFKAMWYRGHTAGTSVVLEALARVGEVDTPTARRAFDWLIGSQRDDGSWGGGDSAGIGTVEETAWALRALLAAGTRPDNPVVLNALDWLLAAQSEDGQWPGAAISELVKDGYQYFNLAITNGLALRALGRCLAAAVEEPAHSGMR